MPYTLDELRNYKIDREAVGTPTRLMIFTNECNNACRHCFIKDKNTVSFSFKEAKDLIDKYSSASVLCLSGGEPTLHPDVCEILTYAKKKGMITFLMTNGRTFSDCAFLNQLSLAGMDRVVISWHSHLMDVHEDITGIDKSFDESLQGLMNCLGKGIPTQAMLIVQKMNYQDIDKTIQFLMDLKVNVISIESLIFAGNAIDNLDKLSIRASEIAPYLEKGLDLLIEKEYCFYVNSFPMCLFQEKYWDYFSCSRNRVTATNLKFKEESELVSSGTSQSGKCVGCNLATRCNGIWIPYYSIYGDGEFKPIEVKD
jgi:MoaA/NifB/PqqE/SkfB family radical SAM enzyme